MCVIGPPTRAAAEAMLPLCCPVCGPGCDLDDAALEELFHILMSSSEHRSAVQSALASMATRYGEGTVSCDLFHWAELS